MQFNIESFEKVSSTAVILFTFLYVLHWAIRKLPEIVKMHVDSNTKVLEVMGVLIAKIEALEKAVHDCTGRRDNR